MDLWSNHWQYSPPLLKHQYRKFRTQLPGPIASSRSTWTHFHATSEPSADAAPDTCTSRKPTHTTTASSIASDWTAHDPATHSTAATGLADQRNPSSPWSSTSDQIWTGNTPATKVQGLCSRLGGAWIEKSRDVTLRHVTAVGLLAFDCSVIQRSRMNLFGCVCNKIFNMDVMSVLFSA